MFVDNNLILSGSIAQIQGAPGGPGQVTSTITGQTVTGATAVNSTSCLDLSQNRDLGEGADLYARFQITTAFAGLTALDIQVASSDDAAQSVNVTVHNSLQAIPVANLTAGASFDLQQEKRRHGTTKIYYSVCIAVQAACFVVLVGIIKGWWCDDL